MSRREEVDKALADIDWANEDYEGNWYAVLPLARTLADEIDGLRMAQGCTRGQRTTQYCAEAADRDRVIGELLAMLKPHGSAVANTGPALLDRNEIYARACAIAGRTE